jgi:hypothetical protein
LLVVAAAVPLDKVVSFAIALKDKVAAVVLDEEVGARVVFDDVFAAAAMPRRSLA